MGGTRLAASVAALLTVAGCTASTGADGAATGSSSAPGPAASPSPTGAVPAPPTPVATGTAAESGDTDVPFLDADAEAVADPSTDARLTVTGVRVGRHGDYDRTVFDLAGTGTPGWRVDHVSQAAEDPSGKAVELAGDGIVQVVLTGTGYPTDTGFDEWAGAPITTEGYAQLWEVHFVGTFEGQTQAFLGTKDRDAAFRVFSLADPLRVVVDVRH